MGTAVQVKEPVRCGPQLRLDPRPLAALQLRVFTAGGVSVSLAAAALRMECLAAVNNKHRPCLTFCWLAASWAAGSYSCPREVQACFFLFLLAGHRGSGARRDRVVTLAPTG